MHPITKDIENDLTSLETLPNELNDIPISLNINFDKYALNIVKNYISNNIFSKKIDNIVINNTLKIKDIVKLIEVDLKQIQILQNKTSINNFFPYYKTCKFLIEYIDGKISNTSLNDSKSKSRIEESSTALKFLKDYFEKFKLNFKWSKTHLNYAYQNL